MNIYQRKAKGAWYIDYSRNGRRVRKSLKTTCKKTAVLIAKDLDVKIAKNEYLGIREQKQITFDRLCTEYLEISKASKVHRSYLRDITNIRFLKEYFQGKLINDITAHDVEVYKCRRREKLSSASVNREISCIKHMFTKAIEWDYISENPLRSVMKLKEPPGRTRYLNSEEEKRLLKCCNGHTKHIVIMALNTGMRRGEILNLKWSDIDLRNRTITIYKSKNNEVRTIPINSQLMISLVEMGSQLPDQYVFSNDDGNAFTTIKKGFRAALKRAGIANFRFHDLRHTFASKLVMAGADIRTVQQLLGHKDIRMTMRYSHLSTDHLRDAVRLLDNDTYLAHPGLHRTAMSAKH